MDPLKNAFDLQFWIICLIICIAQLLNVIFVRKGLISAVSVSVAEVVQQSWAQMFKKHDEFRAEMKETANLHELSILELKERCGRLESKEKINRSDIDEILEKVRNL